MAPNQPLIQPLYILPESEYEVEKRTVCSGFQPKRKQILLAIRSRFENLQRQRKKGGGRKDAGQAFVADAEGSLGGKRCSSPSARGRGKRRGGCSRGGYRNHKDEEEEEQHKATGGKAGGGKAFNTKGDSTKCESCRETEHKSVRCPDRICGVYGGEGHSLTVCANFVTVLAFEGTKGRKGDSDVAISGQREGGSVCVTHQASIAMTQIMRGVAVRSLGK